MAGAEVHAAAGRTRAGVRAQRAAHRRRDLDLAPAERGIERAKNRDANDRPHRVVVGVGIDVDRTAGRDQRIVADTGRHDGMHIDEVEVDRHADCAAGDTHDHGVHVDRRIRADRETAHGTGLTDVRAIGHAGAGISAHSEVDPCRPDGQPAASRRTDVEVEVLLAGRADRDRPGFEHRAPQGRGARAGVVDHHHGGADTGDATGSGQRMHIDALVHAARDHHRAARRQRARGRRRGIGVDVEDVDARGDADSTDAHGAADHVRVQVFTGTHLQPVSRIDRCAADDRGGSDDQRRSRDLVLDVQRDTADQAGIHARAHAALGAADPGRVGTGLFVAYAADAAHALVARVGALRLCIVVDALAIAVQGVVVGACAGVTRIGKVLVELRPDVPHRDGACQAHSASRATDRQAVDGLDRRRIDGDVVLGLHAAIANDAGRRVVVQAAHVDRTADAHEAAGDRQCEGLHRGLVAGDDDHVLRRVCRGVVVEIDICSADGRLGLGREQVDRQRAGCANEAAAAGDRQMEQVLAGTSLDDHAVGGHGAEVATGRRAVAHREPGAVTERRHVGAVGDQGRRVLVDHDDTDGRANPDIAYAETAVDQHDLGVVGGAHEDVAAGTHLAPD